jgi:hypothetical protein
VIEEAKRILSTIHNFTEIEVYENYVAIYYENATRMIQIRPVEKILQLNHDFGNVGKIVINAVQNMDFLTKFLGSLQSLNKLSINIRSTYDAIPEAMIDALVPLGLKQLYLEEFTGLQSVAGVEKLHTVELLLMPPTLSTFPSSMNDMVSLRVIVFHYNNNTDVQLLALVPLLELFKSRGNYTPLRFYHTSAAFKENVKDAVQNESDMYAVEFHDNSDRIFLEKKVPLEEDAPEFRTGNGRAFEVHNTFQRKYEELKENIDVMKEYVGDWDVAPTDTLTTATSNVEDADRSKAFAARFAVLKYYLQHMIDVVANDEKSMMTYEAFKAVVKEGEEWINNNGDRFKIVLVTKIVSAYLFNKTTKLYETYVDDVENDVKNQSTFAKYDGQLNKDEENLKLDRIFHRLRYESISGQLYVYSVLAMKFILKINNPNLTKEYISRFIDECAHAYGEREQDISCVRGIRERLVLVFDSAFKSLCCHQKLCVNVDRTVIDSMCPANIDLVVDAIKENNTYNTYSGQWSYDPSNANLPIDKRREAFVDFMVKKYTKGIASKEEIAKAREAIEEKLRHLEETGNANFACKDVDEIFNSKDLLPCEVFDEDARGDDEQKEDDARGDDEQKEDDARGDDEQKEDDARGDDEQKEDDTEPKKEKCCCVTGTGKPCTRKAVAGSKYCTQHKKAIITNNGKCSKKQAVPIC